jgi:citrate synthase
MVYMGSPDSIQGAIAAGILSMGSQFGGVQEQVGRHLEEIIAAPDPDTKAREIIAAYQAAKQPLPGFGHPHHRPEDPRTQKLLKVAEAEGVPGQAHRSFAHACQGGRRRAWQAYHHQRDGRAARRNRRSVEDHAGIRRNPPAHPASSATSTRSNSGPRRTTLA